ncbi:hypothetical protein K438DRAFT_1968843 [Mycena galopus ATCC 62051]|nr:hypothetical protein K438DRAFT_1968843 [Mycena galopus ATCC 62051]
MRAPNSAGGSSAFEGSTFVVIASIHTVYYISTLSLSPRFDGLLYTQLFRRTLSAHQSFCVLHRPVGYWALGTGQWALGSARIYRTPHHSDGAAPDVSLSPARNEYQCMRMRILMRGVSINLIRYGNPSVSNSAVPFPEAP